MIISVNDAKKYVDVKGWSDEKIARKLTAIEHTIRKYTNNEFKVFGCRSTAEIIGSRFLCDVQMPFSEGDTVQVSQSTHNDGLYVLTSAYNTQLMVDETLTDEAKVLVTKIYYPEDVVDCALNLLEWDINNRQKVGIKSETLSRHSVTYEDSASMFNGYPKGILNSVTLYKKARC